MTPLLTPVIDLLEHETALIITAALVVILILGYLTRKPRNPRHRKPAPQTGTQQTRPLHATSCPLCPWGSGLKQTTIEAETALVTHYTRQHA